MIFQINSSNYDIKYDIDDIEYNYEDENNLVLLDLNLSKDKSIKIKERVIEWLKFPTNQNAEDIFKGGYFILHYNKTSKALTIYRDPSGIKTGYYHLNSNGLTISTKVHYLAKKVGVKSFNNKSISMLLSLDFCFDGYTIYNDIHEFKMGMEICFVNLIIQSEKKSIIELAKKDNTLGFKENVVRLRDEINTVHANLASANNVVYLSGGIDSCVMLSALHDVVDTKDIRSVSFKVKGTDQDETVYAQSIAKHLNVPCEIKEIDPFKPVSLDYFENTILKMNNPYIGCWIFTPEGELNETFFAGQDTRLHTPDVHNIDAFVFDLYINKRKLPLSNLSENIFSTVHKKLNLERSSSKPLKHLDRLSAVGNPEKYLLKYIFKFKEQLKGTSLEDNAKELKEFFNLSGNITNKRHLYNEIVRIKWGEQYTDDIRYMQDMARISSTYIAMPFYDKQLSEFSSSIPFEYASMFEQGKDTFTNSNVRVNKIILREAYKDKLNPDVLYRKKAVSITNFLLFEGSIGKNVYKIIKNDLNSNHSFIKHYGLEKLVLPFQSKKNGWEIEDQNYLMKIYYISTLCVYFKNILI